MHRDDASLLSNSLFFRFPFSSNPSLSSPSPCPHSVQQYLAASLALLSAHPLNSNEWALPLTHSISVPPFLWFPALLSTPPLLIEALSISITPQPPFLRVNLLWSRETWAECKKGNVSRYVCSCRVIFALSSISHAAIQRLRPLIQSNCPRHSACIHSLNVTVLVMEGV